MAVAWWTRQLTRPLWGLRSAQVALRMENEEYLRQHPELRVLTGAFMSAALREEPEDTVGFAAQYFQRADLKGMVTQAMEEQARAQ